MGQSHRRGCRSSAAAVAAGPTRSMSRVSTTPHPHHCCTRGCTYRRKARSATGNRLHPPGRRKRGKVVVGREWVRVPRLRTKLIAVSILHRRCIHPVESSGVISHAMVVGCVHGGWHLTVRIKLPRRLPVESLGLVTMGARRTRSWLIVIQVVMMMMMMMVVHSGFSRRMVSINCCTHVRDLPLLIVLCR